MDSLQQIVKNLKKEEIRNFKIYTKRFQRNDDIKIAILFDKLRSGKFDGNDDELVKVLFENNPANMNAYYRLKNRLKTELEKSLVNLHHNLDAKVTTINYITLSSLFSYKSQYSLALYYMKKAEKISIQSEFYNLLEFIYAEIISLSYSFNEINPLEYIEKKRVNAEKNKVLTEANHAIAAISYKLRITNFNKIAEDVVGTLQQIVNELEIANEVYKTPKVRINIYLCISDVLLKNKDFQGLENYLINTLNEFEQENFFNKSTHFYKIHILSWIVNTMLVNKKWTEILNYTQLLYEELNRYNRLYYDKFIWTYHQGMITSYMLSDRVEDAIQLLEDIKEEAAYKGNTFYDYAIYVNLTLCYYFQKETSVAIKNLAHLLTKDIYPKLSQELQFSLAILESILHYENKNTDFVGYRLAEIKRQFRALLKREDYQEEKTFLKILNSLVNRPDPLRDKNVHKAMAAYVEKSSTFQVGSGKHIDFGVWVRCKLEKKDYYPTLLESLETTA